MGFQETNVPVTTPYDETDPAFLLHRARQARDPLDGAAARP